MPPPTEVDQVEIVELSVQQRTDPIGRLTVVNHKADGSYYERIAKEFGIDKERLVICDGGFLEYAEKIENEDQFEKALNCVLAEFYVNVIHSNSHTKDTSIELIRNSLATS